MDAFFDELADQFRLITCQPIPQRWQEFSRTHRLNWNTIPFRRGGNRTLPESSGFYCFAVRSEYPHFPPVFYPLYAGETLNLRRRYAEYLRERNDPNGRIHVRKFLKVFMDEAVFVYATYDAEKDELMDIEKDLNDALMPHYSHRDFSVEVKRARNAW